MEMQIRTVDIDSVFVDPANLRRHPVRNLEAIKASLTRFGQQKPIVVDGDGVCRAGNGTLEAARALGWPEIRIVRTELKGTEAVAYAIADNRTAELAEWDQTALAETLRSLQSEQFDLSAVGFDAAEVDALIEGLAADAAGADEIPPDDCAPVGQFGVIVACKDEADQRAVYDRLTGEGLACKVVCV